MWPFLNSFALTATLGWHGMMGTHEAVAADVQLAAAAQRHLAIQFNREFSKGFVRNP